MLPTVVPPVPVYAGDTLVFPSYTFQEDGLPLNLVAAGWTGWVATWRPTHSSVTATALTVDATAANVGTITVSATAAITRAMGRGGVWDLEATRTGEVRTFVSGVTTYQADVTHG